MKNSGSTNPLIRGSELDLDKDNLTNFEELIYGTNPDLNDTDNDGLPDGIEIKNYHTSPILKDMDNDNMDDYFEISNGFDPLVPDITPPLITSVNIPADIKVGDNVTVTAVVSDDSAVANVILCYSDGITWSYKNMTYENGKYKATLYNVKNATYSIKIIAEDYAYNKRESRIYTFTPTKLEMANQTGPSQGGVGFDFGALIIYVSAGVGMTLILVAVIVYVKQKKKK